MWLGGAGGSAKWENADTHCCFQIRKKDINFSKEIKLFKVLRSALMDCCPSLMFHTGEPHTVIFFFLRIGSRGGESEGMRSIL